MRVAFKEWAVVIAALAAGEQIVILRKGGISEGRRGFQVEHAEFLLYPTQLHQERDLVVPESQKYFDALASSTTAPDPEHVRFEHYAHVVSWRKVETLPQAERLKGQHIWCDEVIATRFDWGNEKNIYALAVRVFRLPEPVVLPVLPSYAGCKSWVDLELDIITDGAVPVLSKEAFNEKLERFHAALDSGNPAGEIHPAD
jgi:hypothetical protein